MKDFKQIWKQLQAEEAKSSVSLPAYPAQQLKINHDKASWILEEQELGNQVSMFVIKTFAQTTVFDSNGRLILKSQIYTPREKAKALVLYSIGGQYTNTLLTEALKNINEDEFSVVNSWILPVVITSTKKLQKAVWEAKRSALKSLINFMKEESINRLSGYELKTKLVKQKNGVKIWSEPKVVGAKSVEYVDEDILKFAYEYFTEFEQFIVKYNTTIFRSQNTDDIPVEL
ncbi:MAG: hypothetical protein P3W91_001070 [Fervidobacterium sp.]|nr:hypothetical protein [Fervidobacterium sp.]